MMDGYENKEEGQGKNGRDIIFSKVIRAGKRTYFLDVKATRNDDYYLTITESKKRFKRNGKRFFEKHKVFLYKEDFDKFTESLEEVINFIKTENPQQQVTEDEVPGEKTTQDETSPEVKEYTSNVDFEDLDETKE